MELPPAPAHESHFSESHILFSVFNLLEYDIINDPPHIFLVAPRGYPLFFNNVKNSDLTVTSRLTSISAFVLLELRWPVFGRENQPE